MEKKNWLYYGVFFSDKGKKFLYNKAKECLKKMKMDIPDDWSIYCDHMTIIYNDGSVEKDNIAKTLVNFIS